MVKFSNYIFCHFEFGISFAPLLLGIQQSRKKHKNRASCRFVSSALTHSWVSYSNETYTTLANSAYMWFLAHAISAVGTRSLQPERTQRTAANSRRTALRAQPFSRTYCCWRCVCNVKRSRFKSGHTHTLPQSRRDCVSIRSVHHCGHCCQQRQHSTVQFIPRHCSVWT